MSRDRTRTRERADSGDGDDPGLDLGLDDDATSRGQPERSGAEGSRAERSAEGGIASRVGARAGRLFSPRAFLGALLATVGGLVAASAVVPLPGAGLLGLFLGAFTIGLVLERRHYVESTVAGGVTLAASTLLEYAVVSALGGLGVPLAAAAGGLGAVLGAVGHYFGRDLRDGLTREL